MEHQFPQSSCLSLDYLSDHSQGENLMFSFLYTSETDRKYLCEKKYYFLQWIAGVLQGTLQIMLLNPQNPFEVCSYYL